MLRICVVQHWGLGDLIMTVPVIAEIRRLAPDSHVTLVVHGGPQRALLAGNPLVDEIVDIPKNLGYRKLAFFFLRLRKTRFDVAYVATRVTPMVALLLRTFSGIRTIIGDSVKHRWLYTHAGTINPQQHRVDRMLDTLALWSRTLPEPPSFPLTLTAQAESAAETLLRMGGTTPGQYLAIHPGSSLIVSGDKRIPVATTGALIADLRREYPELSVALIFGPDDQDLVPVFAPLRDGVIHVTGTSLEVTKAIIAKAAMFVGSDSALGHIAAAFGVPSLTLAGPTIPTETRPYGSLASVVMREEWLACQPCWGTPLYGHCPFNAKCMADIPLSAVYAEVSQSLNRRRASVEACPATANR